MASLITGPNRAYADAYAAANGRINRVSKALETTIKNKGFQALAVAASDRTDEINICGDFPHKTAATQAGLGWIGRHCQLITRKYGPWVRLGTVFTNMRALKKGIPIDRSFCGKCFRCVDACPADALKGTAWYPGISRSEILDVKVCDNWKKENYYQYHNGHNCGICASACPYGAKTLKRPII